jgi:hypothetical protein
MQIAHLGNHLGMDDSTLCRIRLGGRTLIAVACQPRLKSLPRWQLGAAQWDASIAIISRAFVDP